MNDDHAEAIVSDSRIERFADKAMYGAAPMKSVVPEVHLLWMTPDPMGAVAAACRMYEGKPTYNLSDITDEERIHYWDQVQKTHLTAPLEFVKFHFFIEGVDRAFTHQIVRQRTAVYAQESLRFAVKENMASEVSVPPSIDNSPQAKEIYKKAVEKIEFYYHTLINLGVPAEDARALLPHGVTTRLHYCTDLRNLLDHAGNRLCTQAQFVWRKVFNEIVTSIANYQTHWLTTGEGAVGGMNQGMYIAKSAMFRPVCYQLGRCPFQASFDRGCTIRERVELNTSHGRPSSLWHKPMVAKVEVSDLGGPVTYAETDDVAVEAIDPREWLFDPKAAWVQ